jgi:hypothetical protein
VGTSEDLRIFQAKVLIFPFWKFKCDCPNVQLQGNRIWIFYPLIIANLREFSQKDNVN